VNTSEGEFRIRDKKKKSYERVDRLFSNNKVFKILTYYIIFSFVLVLNLLYNLDVKDRSV